MEEREEEKKCFLFALRKPIVVELLPRSHIRRDVLFNVAEINLCQGVSREEAESGSENDFRNIVSTFIVRSPHLLRFPLKTIYNRPDVLFQALLRSG